MATPSSPLLLERLFSSLRNWLWHGWGVCSGNESGVALEQLVASLLQACELPQQPQASSVAKVLLSKYVKKLFGDKALVKGSIRLRSLTELEALERKKSPCPLPETFEAEIASELSNERRLRFNRRKRHKPEEVVVAPVVVSETAVDMESLASISRDWDIGDRTSAPVFVGDLHWADQIVLLHDENFLLRRRLQQLEEESRHRLQMLQKDLLGSYETLAALKQRVDGLVKAGVKKK